MPALHWYWYFNNLISSCKCGIIIFQEEGHFSIFFVQNKWSTIGVWAWKVQLFCNQRSGRLSLHQRKIVFKQARKLQATLFRNYDLIAHSMTGVKCRATSVAKKIKFLFPYQLWQTFDVGCKSGIMYQKDEISHLWNEALKVAKEWNQPSLKWNIENMNW